MLAGTWLLPGDWLLADGWLVAEAELDITGKVMLDIVVDTA